MLTTYERGMIQGERQLVLRLLEAKFDPLPADVKERVEALSPEQLRQLALDLVKGLSLIELGLQD